jgi:hypothetical protein
MVIGLFAGSAFFDDAASSPPRNDILGRRLFLSSSSEQSWQAAMKAETSWKALEANEGRSLGYLVEMMAGIKDVRQLLFISQRQQHHIPFAQRNNLSIRKEELRAIPTSAHQRVLGPTSSHSRLCDLSFADDRSLAILLYRMQSSSLGCTSVARRQRRGTREKEESQSRAVGHSSRAL